MMHTSGDAAALASSPQESAAPPPTEAEAPADPPPPPQDPRSWWPEDDRDVSHARRPQDTGREGQSQGGHPGGGGGDGASSCLPGGRAPSDGTCPEGDLEIECVNHDYEPAGGFLGYYHRKVLQHL